MAAPATPSRKLPKSNFHQSSTPTVAAHPDQSGTDVGNAPHGQDAISAEESEDFTHPDHIIPPLSYDGVENLVIVCCHAIFHPDACSSNFPLSSPYDEHNWYLAPFQKSNKETGKPGEHETFMQHVLAGIDALTSPAAAGNTLLVLSGGATKASLSPLSEARSYYHAALAHELAQGHHGGGRAHRLFAKGRILLEEYATDSFQNFFFSILSFRKATGIYPKHIRIITHAFKAKRFLDLHVPAIRWPAERVQVQGIDPVMSKRELEETVSGEHKYGYAAWLEDPLGTGNTLGQKRQQRGWDPSATQELGEGLEQGIQELLDGKVPESLPWIGTHEVPELENKVNSHALG